MALYELTSDDLVTIDQATFAALKIKEREDLQRLLRERIEVIVPGGYVIAEEFADWDDSSRRIDLLVLDEDASIVVVELKRTEDGGHADLQALRYAAMVSAITFDQVVEAHRAYLARQGVEDDAEAAILEFLGWTHPREEEFAQTTRIVLASAEFSKELTTTVLWLNEQGLDLRCVRMRPYTHDGKAILDVQQVIPLPEAQNYQVKVQHKVALERSSKIASADRGQRYLRFWEQLLAVANPQIDLHRSCSSRNRESLGAMQKGLSMNYVIQSNNCRVELYVKRKSADENKAIFDELFAQKVEIEEDFNGELNWERLDHRRVSRISWKFDDSVDLQDEDTWGEIQQKLVQAMIRLERAIGPRIQHFRDGQTVEV